MVENLDCQDMVEKSSAGSQALPTGSRVGFRSPTRRGRFAGAAGSGCSCASPVVAWAGKSPGVAMAGTPAFFRKRGLRGTGTAEAPDGSLTARPGGFVVRFLRVVGTGTASGRIPSRSTIGRGVESGAAGDASRGRKAGQGGTAEAGTNPNCNK